MFTPNVQHIVDDLRQEFPTVRVGFWNCRRIAGTLTWSQHAYTQENHLDPDFEGNAADIFPFNMATGDQVAAYLRGRYPDIVKVVLWRVKNHFDHVHFDTWPTGINLPPCKGGALQVRHRDGRIGRGFTYDFDNAPVPIPPSDPDPIPAPPIMEVEMPPPLTPKSHPQQIGQLQDLINETYYYPKGEKGLTINQPPTWKSGTSAAVRKWLVPKTADTSAEVLAGEYVNYNMWNGLNADWVRVQAK